MKSCIMIIALGAALALSACKTTEEALMERGGNQLTGEETRALLTGNTATLETSSYTFHGFYREDGTMAGRIGRETASGTWSVNEKGEFCRDWDNDWGGGGPGCFAIYSDGDEYMMIGKEGAEGRDSAFTVDDGNTQSL